MPEPSPTDRIPLTLSLTVDVARRLKAAADAQKRSAGDIVADLLDRHLPRAQGEQKKGKIPYV
jgi:hypothetical protein